MAEWAQPEDKMWAELYDALNGDRPRHSEYLRQMTFNSAIRGGGSGNWGWLGNAIAALVGERGSIAQVAKPLENENDWGINEPLADDSHHTYTMIGQAVIKEEFRRRGWAPEIVERLRPELRQCFAALLWCSTHPESLLKSVISPPGARAQGARTERRFRDYILLRCAGFSVEDIERRAIDGAGIMKRVNRIYDFKEVSIRAVIDKVLPWLREEFAPVWAAFQERGYAGLSEFFVHGTRVPFEFYRTDNGFAAAMEQNPNGNNAPCWATKWERGEKAPIGFPDRPLGRSGKEMGSAKIVPEGGKVIAESKSIGRWSAPLPGGRLLGYVRTDKCGVTNKMPVAQPPDDPPSDPPTHEDPPVTPTPEKPKRWWHKR